MWNVKTKVIPVIPATDETISKSIRNDLSNILVKTKSRNYRKQSFWAPHTY
jgi:hypothetical protein